MKKYFSLRQATCSTLMQPCVLHNQRTNWDFFREQVKSTLNAQSLLKDHNDMIASNRIFQCYYSTSRLEFNSIYLMAGIHDVITEIRKIQSGLPQGVLSPLLYLLYTAALSADANVSIATFADDMAVLATRRES